MRRLFFLAAAISLIGCGSATDVVEADPILARIGTYTLRTVDGKPLPYPFPQAPGYELLASSITLTAAKTFTARDDQRWTEAGQVHTGFVESSGTFTITGVDLALHFSTGEETHELFSGDDEITGYCCGSVWVYRR